MTEQNILTIENEFLRAEITTRGAELCALFDKTHDRRVLKPRGESSWNGIAPILFPICGRLCEQTTLIDGKEFHMGTHGFASKAIFTVLDHTEARIVLTLTDNDELRETCYPFRFLLTVEYVLDGASITTCVRVKNRDERPLPFSVGFHPGFSLPSDAEGSLDDCYLDFPNANETAIWKLSPRALLTGENIPFPLENGHRLCLREDMLAEINSLFFVGSGNTVTFASSISDRRIRVDYEGFPYLGFWRPNDPDARFLCIEPWIGSPDLDGKCTELSEKKDMLLLPAGEEHSVKYRVTVE